MSVIGSNFPILQAPLYPAASNQQGNAIKAELDAWAKRQEETRQALSQIKPPDWRAQQKAAAEQRVQQIKDQIKMLTMMAGACDPKANARQITQLAKQLAAAVQEYASACGTDTPQPTVSAPASGAAQSAAANLSPAAGAPAAASPPPADTAPASPSPAATGTSDPHGKTGAEGATVGQQSSVADQAFIKEVRDLLEKLKALARLQQARMQGDGHGEISASFDAIGQVEKGLVDIATQSITASAPSINIFA